MSLSLDPGVPCLFLSPHLDDAVLSCGALISRLTRTNPVVVATLFTTCSEPPHIRSTRSYLRDCGAADAPSLFVERRREDETVLAGAGAGSVHLGFPDAAFRRRNSAGGRSGRRHVYPTYRFHIGRGRVSTADRPMIRQAAAAVDAVAREMAAGYVFVPLAVGRHVDHVITRQIGLGSAGRVVFYADFPYVLHSSPDQAFLGDHRLAEVAWTQGLEEKADLVAGYGTQMGALFPGGGMPVAPERYYVPRAEPARQRRRGGAEGEAAA